MDEFYLLWGVTLSLEVLCTFGCIYKYYYLRKLCSSYKLSLDQGVNSVVATNVSNDKQCLALVRGHVKAVGPPIRSLNSLSAVGVIQKLTVKEHAVHQDRFGYWFPAQNLIDSHITVVPFVLKDGKYKVHVASPMDAQYLSLDIVEDHFEPSVSSFLSLLFGFHRRGYQYTEQLLKENTIVTGFGQLIVNKKGEMILVPPSDGISYILTTMDPETLSQDLRLRKKCLGISCAVLALFGACIAGVIAYKYWRTNIRRLAEEKLYDQVRRQRETQNDELNAESFICIVCAIRPREVVSLPCGHVCLCYECSELLQRKPCSICRQPVQNTHIIILS